MIRRNLTVALCFAGAALLAGSFAIAQQAEKSKPAAGGQQAENTKQAPGAQQEMQLPPGWTEADMQACMAAGTPGKMHQYLAQSAGVWHGKDTMWMGSGSEPVTSTCTTTMTPMMDGRFVKCEVTGEMPGQGPFNGFGIYGFDNVSQKFVSIWVDNCGTGIMHGTGELTPDARVMTWNYAYNCPITKKPTVMREVETTTGPNSKTFEMFGNDPKTGQEYKMMTIEYTRQP